ncbi:MAG: HAD family hydrolase, partial [Calditrichaeota bacterium]|nr:HAD family hydrolase [Calditrichota bacterium]
RSQVDDFAQMGYRTIAVAADSDEQGWQLVGLIPLFDPPREDSAETVARAMEMGVTVKMITGDNIAIARQIAGKLNLGTRLLPAGALDDTPSGHLEETVENADGFAEVFPEHKFLIVRLLQKLKHFVGMSG